MRVPEKKVPKSLDGDDEAGLAGRLARALAKPRRNRGVRGPKSQRAMRMMRPESNPTAPTPDSSFANYFFDFFRSELRIGRLVGRFFIVAAAGSGSDGRVARRARLLGSFQAHENRGLAPRAGPYDTASVLTSASSARPRRLPNLTNP